MAVTAREHFDGAAGVARRHVYPSGLDDGAAIAAAEAAVAALGISEGPSYIQLILSATGRVIMEVAARLGGGHDSEICRAGGGRRPGRCGGERGGGLAGGRGRRRAAPAGRHA